MILWLRADMLDVLGLSGGLASLVVGIVLLYDCLFDTTAGTQTAKTVVGGVFFALGLVIVFLVVKDWLVWRRRALGRAEKNIKSSGLKYPL